MMLVRMLLMKQEKKVSETGVLTSTCLLIYLYANLIFICPPGLRATACMSQTQHFLLLEGPHHLFIGQIRDYRGSVLQILLQILLFYQSADCNVAIGLHS